MKLNIRLAESKDIPALTDLIGLSVRGLSIGYYTPAQIESAIKYIFGIDSQLIADETYYVAESNDTIAGCGGWSKRNTLYGGDQQKAVADPLLNPETDAARIRAFFVHPDFARQGIGRKIIEVCEGAAKNNSFTALELGATLPGVPLYTALGYYPVKEISEMLPDGEILGIVKMRKEVV